MASNDPHSRPLDTRGGAPASPSQSAGGPSAPQTSGQGTVTMLPPDEYNRNLLANVHPADWTNPDPPPRYNLVVIGAGTAGLVTAAGAAGLGAKVALIERHFLGGDCLNVGCVPSKALIRAARAYADVQSAGEFGIEVPPGSRVDFPTVMERMRRLRAQISANDSVKRFRDLGVDVYLGQAKFTARDAVQVGTKTLRFKRAAIATGTRPSEPSLPGIDDISYLTNETVFSLTELPPRLAVIGAGPIGCELAQAFARFGSQVYLVEASHGILPKEDRSAAKIVEQGFVREGIQILCCGKELQLVPSDTGKRLVVDSHGKHFDITVDEVLLSVGRTPNVEGLELENAGVEYNQQGVSVNDRLQTTNSRIYAAGDICSHLKFTHAADAMARIVIQNALFFGRAQASTLTIPWCTYTDPEIAHVGLYERNASERGIDVQIFDQHFHDVDRAILDGETDGFARVLVKKGTDRILGATIVASHAGDMISQMSLAMAGGLGLKTIGKTIYPYPTQAECIKKIADAYNRTRLTPRVKGLFEKWFSWTQ